MSYQSLFKFNKTNLSIHFKIYNSLYDWNIETKKREIGRVNWPRSMKGNKGCMESCWCNNLQTDLEYTYYAICVVVITKLYKIDV